MYPFTISFDLFAYRAFLRTGAARYTLTRPTAYFFAAIYKEKCLLHLQSIWQKVDLARAAVS